MPFKNKNVAERVTSQVIKAFEDTTIEAFFQFQDTIDSEIFFWDRMTRRKNGETVFSPRNIVDTGTFMRSQYLEPVSKTKTLIGWSADYSSTILYGRKRADGTTMPGRDWIGATLHRWDIKEEFERNLKRRLRSV